ncbi:hypothetical protein SASPL_150180 [Salvia splendens]|uniref:Leucine-rich repeat-containing N-terminal plant-type domain-containing protein n=1 Tax=Salvia splendens TaxID=180675 RepID=A0A8X8W5R1_SALSN|nr:hypothetical protein SASPL_150180 [Salvia splendens]
MCNTNRFHNRSRWSSCFQKAITVDTNGVLSNNWLINNTSICEWAGVSCGINRHRVTALNLSNFALHGKLTPHLGNLTFLQSLDISSNNFTGVLPIELSKLRHLKQVIGTSNNFSGEIPRVKAIYHQYQPPHQIHSMFAKFDRLLDMMESRMDAVDRSVENLRRKQYPSPHQYGGSRNIPDGFLSCHPEDAANRCVGYPRAPPPPEPQPHPTPSPPYAQRTRRSYLPHNQQPPARSSSSGYTARPNANQRLLNASTSGTGSWSRNSHPDSRIACAKALTRYVRSPVSDGSPARPTRRWDRPENHVQQRVSAYEPPAPTGWPPRPQPSPVRQPSCWDPPKQQGYPPHEPPTPVEPLDLECARFQPLPQPPQPHCNRRDVDEDRCCGEVVTHTRSPTLDVSLGRYESGYVNEGTNLNEVDSYLSGLDVQIAYSCSDCVDDSGKGEEELCDSNDSILETGAKEAMGRGMPSENRGSRESGDGRPEDQQVSSFMEIYLSSSIQEFEFDEKSAWSDADEDVEISEHQEEGGASSSQSDENTRVQALLEVGGNCGMLKYGTGLRRESRY